MKRCALSHVGQMGLIARSLAALLSVVSFFVPPAVWAYGCTGTLDFVTVNPNGIITVDSASSGLGAFNVCQLGATGNGIAPDVCSGILASLIAAKETGEQVQWQFNDSLTCTTHTQGTWLSGWYYGPVLL